VNASVSPSRALRHWRVRPKRAQRRPKIALHRPSVALYLPAMKCGANISQTKEGKIRHFIIESHPKSEASKNSEGMGIESEGTPKVPHEYACSYFSMFTNPAARGFLPSWGLWTAAIIESKKKMKKSP
jgi:hypothetical protein